MPMPRAEFNKRLLQPAKRKQSPPKDKCECGRVGKWTDNQRVYCDRCLGDQKVIN